MNLLRELPPGTIPPHLLNAIRVEALRAVTQYAEGRVSDIARGAETAELAAVLVDKFVEGLAKGLHIVGVDTEVRELGDRLVRTLDPDFEAHRDARWNARPASLSTPKPA